MGFVGDVMLDRGVLLQTRSQGDYRFPFLKIKEDLEKFDILFGNLESMISDKGANQGSIYSFRAPPETMEGLVYAGFDVLSIANNHSFDWGINALTDTKERLIKEKIVPVGGGLSAYDPVFLNEKDTIIAFLAYSAVGAPGWATTESVPGIAWYSDERLEEGIKIAEADSDIVVVSIHYGEEYQKSPNEEQIRISERAIDLGADMVIGHHPHVIQPVIEYKEGIIAYSLGNFVFDQAFSEETMTGLLLEVKIKDGKINSYNPIEVRINDYFQPTIK